MPRASRGCAASVLEGHQRGPGTLPKTLLLLVPTIRPNAFDGSLLHRAGACVPAPGDRKIILLWEKVTLKFTRLNKHRISK